MDPHKAARTDRRGVDETRTERTADLPNIINVQRERHSIEHLQWLTQTHSTHMLPQLCTSVYSTI